MIEWEWFVTWGLLVLTLTASIVRTVMWRKSATKAINDLETRLKASAAIRSVSGKTYQERLQDEYRKRGISGA